MSAFGLTRLQIVNRVLSRLRESTVATTSSTTYALLIANLVDSVKSDIEFSWQWRDLRNTFNLTATPGTSLYTFTSSGQYARILDMWNTTTKGRMRRGTFADFNTKFFGVNTVQTGDPTMFLPAGLDSNYDLQVDIWPVPTATNALKANLYVPQPALTNDADVPLIPNQVLIEGVLAHAMAERGDDSGTQAQLQMSYYRDMLASAIAREAGGDESEVIWEVV